MNATAVWGITREEALELMERYLDTDAMRKHCLAAEAIMRALAPRFGADPDMWGLVGLLHDLDYNETRDHMERHTLETEKILLDRGVHPDIIEAIKTHNAENLGLTRTKPIDFALTAAETITGMIVAATLVTPEKKIDSLKTSSVRKRMKAKEFARSVNRDHIRLCEQISIPLEEFITLSIDAMQSISGKLGL
ncbi:MAG: HDIG domain-containing protein [Desulfomonile sp.]|nr:HDIG domain-containing protein [Desulfomonile sp.]